MAVITTSFTPPPIRIPFAGAGGMDQIDTIIPRAEILFTLSDAAVTLSGVGDIQLLNILCTLPSTYAYVLQDISILRFQGVDADAWQPSGSCTMRNTGLPAYKQSMDFFARPHYNLSATTLARSYHLANVDPIGKVMTPSQTSAGATGAMTLQIQLMNVDLNQSAMIIDGFYARFLEFDLNQARFWAVNTPIPVR